MNRPTPREFQIALIQLLMKAQTDPAFNGRCRRNPAQAFREAAGLDVPDGCTLRCVDAEVGEVLVPLPVWQSTYPGRELTDLQLEAVAGGTGEEVVVPVTEELVPEFEMMGPGLKAFASDLREMNQYNAVLDKVDVVLGNAKGGAEQAVSGLTKGGKIAVGAVTTAAAAVGGWFASTFHL